MKWEGKCQEEGNIMFAVNESKVKGERDTQNYLP